MKSILLVVLASALVGLGLGTALALVEVRPWAASQKFERQAADDSLPTSVPKVEGVPQAEVLETVFEFGTIERGTTMSHVFKVRNVGGAPLSLRVGEPTCKCTVGNVSTNVIAPGEVAEIELQWHAKTSAGPFRHGAPLLTNDPRQSRIELRVVGKVVESTAMHPSELLFGTVAAGQTGEASIYLLAFVEPEVKVLSYDVSGVEFAKQVQIAVEPMEDDLLQASEANAGVKITASYRAGKTIGPFSGWLNLETNLAKASTLTVSMLGNVTGDIAIYGPGWNPRLGVLKLGSVLGAKGTKVRLKISVSGEHALATELTVASIDPPELKVTLGQRQEMGKKLLHIPLLVEIPVGTRPLVRAGGQTSDEARIVLHTTHPQSPGVTMRVQFMVH